VVADPPTGCQVSEITNKQLESIMRGTIRIWNKVLTASGAGCVNAPITRVVRSDPSATTLAFKHYLSQVNAAALACTEGGAGWKQLEGPGSSNTVWPEAGIAGCGATSLSALLTASGGPALVAKVDATRGSIGYATLPDVEAGKSGATDWLKLQNNGVSNKLAVARTVSPLEEASRSARCEGSVYGVPKSAKTTVANPQDSDWTAVTGSNPNVAGFTGEVDAYPLCMLTYDVALTQYSKAGVSEAQEGTVAAYLAGVVTADEGQDAVETGEEFYAPLPSTVSPASDVLGAARLAAGKIGF
jgi:ABC-type phosphate transport system substrate-binding protein